MGNAPSVTGPDRGRPHVKRNMTKGDQTSGLRPVNYSTNESENELVGEDEIEFFSREKLTSGTNRKSSDKVTQRSSFRHTFPGKMQPDDRRLSTVWPILILQSVVTLAVSWLCTNHQHVFSRFVKLSDGVWKKILISLCISCHFIMKYLIQTLDHELTAN